LKLESTTILRYCDVINDNVNKHGVIFINSVIRQTSKRTDNTTSIYDTCMRFLNDKG